MSKVGKQSIIIPADVQLTIGDNQLKIKGPKGELNQSIPAQIRLELKDLAGKQKKLTVIPKKETKNSSALWGSLRALVFNMVKGVTEGFEKKLEIEGVGYRASLEDNKLILSLGFSHPIEMEAPPGIEFKVDRNIITVSGIDKQSVGQVAARIRAFRKPEPYKGKGIRYTDEVVRRKAGKKAAGAE